MTLEELVVVVAEQKEDLLSEEYSAYCSRQEVAYRTMRSKLAQVVIGVRRSGKSTLCVKYLREHKANAAYVNLDDERLADINVDDLNTLLEAMYVVYGSNVDCLFFDELQNADSWPLFINRLLRGHKHIFLTGSNAKLLSNELMTHMTGRHNAVSLYPFSFAEYCQIKQVEPNAITTRQRAALIEALHSYLKEGGMPELLNEADRRMYINSLLNTIIRVDIAKRFRIRHPDALFKMATYMCDNYGQEFVPKTVGELFGISSKTASLYFSYLKEAFLLIGVPKFSFKAQERIRNEKAYVVDVAFAEEHDGSFSLENLGWKLENVVCIELLRRNKRLNNEVFYYKDPSFECDFVVTHGSSVQQLIQVSYDITSPKTRARELNGLVKAARKFNCHNLILLTFDTKEHFELNGEIIHILPATEWLANRK